MDIRGAPRRGIHRAAFGEEVDRGDPHARHGGRREADPGHRREVARRAEVRGALLATVGLVKRRSGAGKKLRPKQTAEQTMAERLAAWAVDAEFSRLTPA